MKIKRIWGCIGLGSLLVVLAGISPAVGESDKLGGTERPVMEAMGAPSFGAEDWVPPQGETRVVKVETPSLGAEDWVPPQGETRVVKVEPPSFGAEDFLVAETPSSEAADWAGAMEPSDAAGTGAIPAPAPEKR
jgi:hypothetical protein